MRSSLPHESFTLERGTNDHWVMTNRRKSHRGKGNIPAIKQLLFEYALESRGLRNLTSRMMELTIIIV